MTLTHYFLGSAYLSVSVQRDKKNEKVMSERIRAVLLQHYVLCLVLLQGCREETENKAGSEAVSTILLSEKNNSGVILSYAADLE